MNNIFSLTGNVKLFFVGFYSGLFIFIPLCGISQFNPECHGVIIDSSQGTPQFQKSSHGCNRQSAAFNNKYGLQSSFIPNNAIPAKIIKVNFHVIQTEDPSNRGNFESGVSAHTNLLNDLINQVNYKYNSIIVPSDPVTSVCGNNCHISDSKIQFELSGIYYHQNNDAYGRGPCDRTYFNQYGVNTSSELNIFFQGTPPGVGGCTNFPSYNLGENTFIGMTNIYKAYVDNPDNFWGAVTVLAHELGHSLGLAHTYLPTCCPESCDINSTDYLFDVFGPVGQQICHHDYPPFGCSTNTCTNNMLGGTASAGYLSPLQLGRIHRNLSIKSIRKYVKECTYSSIPIQINSNETWDFDFKMYNPVSVADGATLTVACSTYVPCFVASTVGNASTLIVGQDAYFHIDPASSLTVNYGSTLTIENGGKLELHEYSQLIIKNGGKLIVEEGALLFTHFNSLVHIQTGGELILKNTTAGKGLCIGCNSWFDDTAELRVEGTLTTTAGVDLKNTGNGLFSFYGSGNYSSKIIFFVIQKCFVNLIAV